MKERGNEKHDRTVLLQHCLKQILRGGHDDFEVLIAADGHSPKIAQTVAGNSDAIGYVYRKKNKTYINFASTDEVCGSRCDHLRGKEIMVLEEDEAGNVIASHWDDIYVD